MAIAILCAALLALLCIGLGFNVVLARIDGRVTYGGEINPTSRLYKAQRAHGNTVEYSPALALLIYILGQSPQPGWVVWIMILVTLCRYLHAIGILFPATMAKPNPLRFVGALGTFIFGFILVGLTFWQGVRTLNLG